MLQVFKIFSDSACAGRTRVSSSLVPSPNADFSRVKDPSVSEGLGSNKLPRDALSQFSTFFNFETCNIGLCFIFQFERSRYLKEWQIQVLSWRPSPNP